MIERLRIQNFKALRDVTLELTPVHALIGPNDTGKTSILEAVAALCRSVDHPLNHAFLGRWEGRELVWRQERESLVQFDVWLHGEAGTSDYSLSVSFGPTDRNPRVRSESVRGVAANCEWTHLNAKRSMVCAAFNGEDLGDPTAEAMRVHEALNGVHYYRWNAQFLALPVAQDIERRFRMEPSGFGLALVLDNILGVDRDAFTALEKRFVEAFPQFAGIQLAPQSAYRQPFDDAMAVPMLQQGPGKGVYFRLHNGSPPLPASQASDGTLLVLAYLAVLYQPDPPRVLLIEEPENGIHPRRLSDVLGVLRELVAEQGRTQVLMTTHSPYLLDLFKPEEVTLCRKQDDGSITTLRLSESETVRHQMDIFLLGEIWTGEESDDALAESPKTAEESAS